MSQQYVETLRMAHQEFNAKNYDRAQNLVAAQTKLTDHGRNQVITTRAEFRGWMQNFHTMSSDLRIVDAQYIDAGEYVIAQFRAVGTQDGPMDPFPFPASGKPFSLDVCEIWRFSAEGQAVEGHNYSDGLGLLMQLGHLPAPGQTGG
jgi:hypothetical protein